ncbi:hypothetical protein HDE_03937 [Halotydeus destructor]|nr:hypothetical protein HDE_03937 [Halotydeus destructor]
MEEVTLRLNEPIFRLNWMIETFLIPTEKEIVLKSKDFSPSGSNDVWFIEVNGSSEDVRISLRLKCRGDCKDEHLKVKIGQRYEYNHDRHTDDLQYYTYTSSRSEPCPVFHLINDTVKTNLKICYTIVYEPTQPSQGGSIAEDCKQLNSISTELPTDFTLIGSDGQVRTHNSDIIDNLLINYNEEEQLADSDNDVRTIWYCVVMATLSVCAIGLYGILRNKLWPLTILSLYLLIAIFGSLFTSGTWRRHPFPFIILSIFTAWTIVYNFLLFKKQSDSGQDLPPQLFS